ncbi:hypothetical protein [Rugamonas rivuli]|uniref:Uncharacterized protein n=1 Tax=Rugamonas rivuli TaxID=2743358 RepID=A0A843SHU1_9BURK|nr:hypothetical protein [Rugamonas rivuli]MQA21574.1 hypothetical protein [Rugamonas rivuli]
MKALVVFAALAIGFAPAGMAQTRRLPAIEQGIYHPEPPFENIKQSFYIRERERPLLNLITDASTSIALFLIDAHNALPGTSKLLAETSGGLRLPPMATVDRTMRFVGTGLYCWQSKDDDHLEFLIEWADITTNARYTDSYVFARRGPGWHFEKHGSIPPWHWTQTERYFQRACPSDS